MTVVLKPYSLKILPIEAVATPLPTPEITPPATTTKRVPVSSCFICMCICPNYDISILTMHIKVPYCVRENHHNRKTRLSFMRNRAYNLKLTVQDLYCTA